MQNRIFHNFLGLLLICAVILVASFVFLFSYLIRTYEVSLFGLLPTIIPVAIFIVLLIISSAYFIAVRLTRKAIKPLGEIDLKKEDTSANSDFSNSITIESIIANMREGLIIVDENGRVMTANKRVLDIFGISKEKNIIHKSIQHIYRSPEFGKTVKQCLVGTHMEMSFIEKDRIYNVSLDPVIIDNANCGAIIFFFDVTEQHKAERQRKEFSANVSHELKTPLTTISALAEMMSNGMAKPEDVVDFADKISNHSKRLIDIIDDIIRLSEFDENKLEKNFTTFDVYTLAKSVIAALQEKAAEKSVQIKLDGQPLKITGNNRLIDELIYNLIDNGIKYNKDGGSVFVSLSEENGLCKIAVTDTGIGISKKHQARVFERFYRIENSRSKKTGGTGLGLSIVKHIVEHHNGKIVFESTEDGGTTFACFLSK